jgi:hypothetical protein
VSIADDRVMPQPMFRLVLFVVFRSGAMVLSAAGQSSAVGILQMRGTQGWSDIVFQVSVAIIVVELALLSVGLNLAAGIEPAMFAAP